LTAALFVEKTNVASASTDEHTSLYLASYISGPWAHGSWNGSISQSPSEGYMIGNIILVNPTSHSLSNLTLSIQIDSSEAINPLLRLWNSSYVLKEPNSSRQSNQFFYDLLKFSSTITFINIGSSQEESICLNFPTSIAFPFYSHNLKIYISQNNFGDTINGQPLIVPQTEAYLQIVNFSAIESDNGTYHQYYNSTLKREMVTVAYNPNFYQRYWNISKYDVYSSNFGLMHLMGSTDGTYFNVTVFNNSTLHVDGITLFGQKPIRGSLDIGEALRDYVMQPNETYIFPVPSTQYQSSAYIGGYIANNTSSTLPTPTPTVPEFPLLTIPLLLSIILATSGLLVYHKRKSQSNLAKKI
jgi:hypothetical protein